MLRSAAARFLLAAALLLGAAPPSNSADPVPVQVYKSPTCGCCAKWVEHLRDRGFAVSVTNVADLRPVKRELGVPFAMASCHTAVVAGYFVEGHVPPEDVERLLAEKPAVAGLALPGMPIGSPGMEGPNAQPYTVLVVGKDGQSAPFAEHRP